MRIAHITQYYSPAICGVKQVVEELAKRQIKEGHEVHVYCSDWDKSKRIKLREETIDGVIVHRCFHIARFANFSTFWPSLFIKLLKERFDIIHSHVFGHPHFVLAAIASKIKGIPHIHTTHCPWTDAHRSTIGRIGVLLSYNTLSRLAFRLTDKIIAITPWEYKFIRRFGGSKEKIVNIPNGMSSEFFSKDTSNNFKIKNKIDGPLILFFGRLNITKGPDKFVEIAKLVLNKHPEARFLIRGPDEGMRERVKKMIGIEKKIMLMEESRDREEIVQMYQSADIFLLPSYREGLPLTLFEAMAAGLPIVATPVNGVPYEMEDKKNGFLVEYGNNELFAQRISELLKDRNLRNRISRNNLEKAKHYQWDLIAKKTLNLYENLLKK